VLGTSLELQLVVSDDDATRRAERALLDEIDRLGAILDQRSPASEIAGWQTTFDCDAVVSPELAEVLELAEMWRAKTRGAFSAAAGASMAPDEFHRLLQGDKLWCVDQSRGVARRLSTLPISLDAIAKGYIVSRSAARVYDVSHVLGVLLNIGGDIQHFGDAPVAVGIADPASHAENARPLAVVHLCNEGLATSGGYRRGTTIDGVWTSHIIDPRAGKPAATIASASVIAPDCDTADALSTAFSVLDPSESIAIAESLPGVGCLIVDARGEITTNAELDNHAPRARR
jgi:thiamine biosynthesis lipoprotein